MFASFVILVMVFVGGSASSGQNLGVEDVTGDIEYGAPKGWRKGGAAEKKYRIGLERLIRAQGEQRITLYSTAAYRQDFGSVTQTFPAGQFRGQRVRFRAHLRCGAVEGWAGLWFRVDTNSRQSVLLDNMRDRPLKGTLDWADYEIVLDVPTNARNLAFGALLSRRGHIWMDDASIEIVGADVETTAQAKEGFPLRADPPAVLRRPQNLDFEAVAEGG